MAANSSMALRSYCGDELHGSLNVSSNGGGDGDEVSDPKFFSVGGLKLSRR